MYVCMYVCMYIYIYIYIYMRVRPRRASGRCLVFASFFFWWHFSLLGVSWSWTKKHGLGASLRTEVKAPGVPNWVHFWVPKTARRTAHPREARRLLLGGPFWVPICCVHLILLGPMAVQYMAPQNFYCAMQMLNFPVFYRCFDRSAWSPCLSLT